MEGSSRRPKRRASLDWKQRIEENQRRKIFGDDEGSQSEDQEQDEEDNSQEASEFPEGVAEGEEDEEDDDDFIVHDDDVPGEDIRAELQSIGIVRHGDEKDTFMEYLEHLAKWLVSAEYAQQASQDRRIQSICHKIEVALADKRDKCVESELWRFAELGFKPALISHPYAAEHKLGPEDEGCGYGCAACQRRCARVDCRVEFFGRQYEPEWASERRLREREETEEDSDALASRRCRELRNGTLLWQSFTLGSWCATRVRLYHALLHFKRQLLESIDRKLGRIIQQHNLTGPQKAEGALQHLLEDGKFCDAMWFWYHGLKKVVEGYMVNDDTREFEGQRAWRGARGGLTKKVKDQLQRIGAPKKPGCLVTCWEADRRDADAGPSNAAADESDGGNQQESAEDSDGESESQPSEVTALESQPGPSADPVETSQHVAPEGNAAEDVISPSRRRLQRRTQAIVVSSSSDEEDEQLTGKRFVKRPRRPATYDDSDEEAEEPHADSLEPALGLVDTPSPTTPPPSMQEPQPGSSGSSDAQKLGLQLEESKQLGAASLAIGHALQNWVEAHEGVCSFASAVARAAARDRCSEGIERLQQLLVVPDAQEEQLGGDLGGESVHELFMKLSRQLSRLAAVEDGQRLDMPARECICVVLQRIKCIVCSG